MAKSKSAKYYASHPEAREVKKKKDTEINRRPEQRAKRASLNKYNREAGTYGNGDKKDARHIGSKIVGFTTEKKNRGSNSDSKGDRKARPK